MSIKLFCLTVGVTLSSCASAGIFLSMNKSDSCSVKNNETFMCKLKKEKIGDKTKFEILKERTEGLVDGLKGTPLNSTS